MAHAFAHGLMQRGPFQRGGVIGRQPCEERTFARRGFGLWWAMYLYVWYLLAVLAWLLRRMDNAFGWAVFSGAYGLCFGGLCAAVYLVAKTPAFALSWWLSGLSYDVMHGAGNFVIMLLLYRPLRTALQTAKRQIRL